MTVMHVWRPGANQI